MKIKAVLSRAALATCALVALSHPTLLDAQSTFGRVSRGIQRIGACWPMADAVDGVFVTEGCINPIAHTWVMPSTGGAVPIKFRVVIPEDYLAAGDGTTNDAGALVNAATAANAVGGGEAVYLTKNYRIGTSQSITAPLVFMPGACLTVDSGAIVALTGAVTAGDMARIFCGAGTVTVVGTPRVSVAWWGGLVAADAAPAFRAMACSNCTMVAPAGTYAFNSQIAAPPTVGAFLPSGVLYQGLHDFTLDLTAATISNTNANADSNLFHFDRVKKFTIKGGTLQGNRFGLAASRENGAMVFSSVVDGDWGGTHIAGNWGGSGAASYGDWFYNFRVHDLRLDAVGICFDYAYMAHVRFDHIVAIGADTNGEQDYATKGGSKCFSVAIDWPNKDFNFTGFGMADTYDMQVTNSDVSGFSTGFLLLSGTQIKSIGNSWHNNAGYGGFGGVGILLSYFPGAYSAMNPSGSAAFPANRVTSIGDTFKNNGSHTPGAGFLIQSAAIPGTGVGSTDVFNDIKVVGATFEGNGGNAMEADATTHVANLNVSGNTYIAGANAQPLQPGAFARAIMNPPPVIAACGVGPTLTAGSSYRSGSFVLGTGTTGCTLTGSFPPFCIVTSGSGGTFTAANNPTQFSISSVSIPTSLFTYRCTDGQQ
jgi:hypothetical protein